MEKFIPETRFVPVDFDPFTGSAIARTVPSTEAQREVFSASLMGKEASCAYNESVSLSLSGDLDRPALDRALIDLVARHEGLRSVLNADGLRTIVFEQLSLHIEFTDLGRKNEKERARDLDAIAAKDTTTPFDLLNGPLFRVHLIDLGNGEHLLRLTGHHVVCDGWSLGIIMADISKLYSGSVLEPAVPLSDYALAVIDFAKSPEHADVETYWLEQFKGAPPRLDLPPDRARPRQKTYNGARLDLDMDPALVKGLKETATRSGASFVTTLLTTFELLLHKLTEQTDIVVGLPAAGQSDLGMKNLVAHCVNLLALRSRIDEERPFIEHLKERRTAVLDAFDNQKYTFGTLLRTLHVAREPGRIPLCPVVFNIDMNMDDGVDFNGLRHRFISNPRRYENFELFLNATGNDQKLTLEWSYNTDLFDEATVRSWMDELVRIATRVATNPQASIADLVGDTTLVGDRQLPSEQWLGASPDYPRDKSISRLWDETVIRFGDRTALELVDQRISYTELDRRVHALTASLLANGVKPGDPVGLCSERNFDLITAMLAVLRCGAAFVPFDPSYPEDRLRFMLDDTNVKVLLTQRSLKASLPPNGAQMIILDEQRHTPVEPIPGLGGPENPAYIMYTSGSTGTPKGVVVPQRAIVRLVKAQNYLPFGPDLTFLQLSNTSFDASTLEIWGALLNGGRLVLQPQVKPTLVEITDTIREKRVTTVWFTAGLFNVLVDEHLERLRGLRHILTGGDVLSVPHVKKALKVLGPGVLINGYGPTENTTFTCCHAIDDERSIKGSVPIGRPIHHTRAYVLDSALAPVAIGQKGELYAGGDGVALGYWQRNELTSERFIRDPFSSDPKAKMYKTGDIVRWTPEGDIEFIGRSDDQVKIRGFRIELGEIENALNGHPLVKDRVVVVRTDLPGEKQLVGYVLPHDRSDAVDPAARERAITALREHLRERLPDHMVPTSFVVMESFPLNPNGKVDKKQLPLPDPRTANLTVQHVAPRNAEEKLLAQIWSKALGIEDIGVHESFFDLGGHSITGIQVLTQIEDRFGRSFPLNVLFQAPTIAELAKLLCVEQVVEQSVLDNLVAIQPDGSRTPLFCVHGDEANHYLPKYLGTDQPFFGFMHQGEEGLRITYTSVETIAAHYITELKHFRQVGPYNLAGYSFGGLVAYEMARQLTRAGDSVPMVILLDTYAPKPFTEIMGQERKFHEPVKNFVMRSIISFFRAIHKPLPTQLRNFHVIDTYDRAISEYVAKDHSGSVTVIKADGSPGTADMGWKDLVKGDLHLRTCIGDHYSMIKEPHVKQLAEVMRSEMDVLQKKSAVDMA